MWILELRLRPMLLLLRDLAGAIGARKEDGGERGFGCSQMEREREEEEDEAQW